MSALAIALLLVVAFVWGQWMMLRPSARDLNLMALRTEGRRLGFHVRLLPPPEWYHGPRLSGGLLACYSLLNGDDDKDLPYFRALRGDDGRWELHYGTPAFWQSVALPEEAAQLIAVEAKGNAVSFWWTEKGTPAGLLPLHALLQTLLAGLR